MTLTLIIIGLAYLAELLLWLPALWQWKKPLAIAQIITILAATLVLLGISLHASSVALALISVYRIINLLRIVDGRTQSDYLFHGARKTSYVLIGVQASIAAIAAASTVISWDSFGWWYELAALQVAGAITVLLSTNRQLHTTQPPELNNEIRNDELPSLTVAIPARNETSDLEACLRSLLQCNYSKLEILVLDDCSQNRRTSEIIRGFAHDGVRFIAGEAPPNHWLAKNYAYEQLAREANGELIMFCGVDARFAPTSLNTVVKTLVQKKKTMLSVLPRNYADREHTLAASVVQSARYAWELCLPRRLLGRPAVLSTCWIITRSSLKAAGGFASYKQSVLPERHLAHRAIEQGQGYSFVCADPLMGISSRKRFSEQLATATRTRYPQLHRRPELVLAVSILEFSLLVWPFIILVIAAASMVPVILVLSLITCGCLVLFYAKIMNLTYRAFLLRGFMLLPVAALYDITLLNYSMWQYEFHEVIWKGRNICMPVMRVFDALPKID